MRTLIALSLLFAASLAQGQAWPSKPVRIVLSNSAGSSPDIVTRLLAERLGRSFNQSFVVDNRPGGEQIIGAEHVARSAPDGYTLYMGTNDSHVANLYRLKSVPYDPDRDFVFVSNVVGSAAFVVLVNAEVPARTFPELVALAKSQPGKVSMAYTVGLGDILSQWIVKRTDGQFLRVPYKVNPQAVQDTASGQVGSVIISYVSAQNFIKAGKLRVVGVTGSQRYALFPDLPTLAEAYPGLIMEGWWFLMATGGTPADVVRRLGAETDRAIAEPELSDRIRSFHFTPGPAITPQQFGERMKLERQRWKELVQEIALQPQ
jgi:tripartite-type tricarboxylate transporter receptor subunit TctC